jgi:hypothetical protein
MHEKSYFQPSLKSPMLAKTSFENVSLTISMIAMMFMKHTIVHIYAGQGHNNNKVFKNNSSSHSCSNNSNKCRCSNLIDLGHLTHSEERLEYMCNLLIKNLNIIITMIFKS